jgi:addiction module HigA family antidote
MYNPPHPGLTLKEDVLPALNLSVSAAAQELGVTRAVLSRILNARARITPLGAERGGSAHLWVKQQAEYDLWQARLKFNQAH